MIFQMEEIFEVGVAQVDKMGYEEIIEADGTQLFGINSMFGGVSLLAILGGTLFQDEHGLIINWEGKVASGFQLVSHFLDKRTVSSFCLVR